MHKLAQANEGLRGSNLRPGRWRNVVSSTFRCLSVLNAATSVVGVAKRELGSETVYLSDGSMLGYAGLKHIDEERRSSELLIGIEEVHQWGKGYGRAVMARLVDYAFTELGLHELTAIVLGNSTRAQRFHGKQGFILALRGKAAPKECPIDETPLRNSTGLERFVE